MLVLALLLQLAPPSGLAVRPAPDTALVERDPATGVGYANFDLLIARDTAAARTLELVSIVMTAHDPAGALVLRRFCDTSGLSPCIRTVPDRMRKLGGDPLAPVLELAPDLGAALERLMRELAE